MKPNFRMAILTALVVVLSFAGPPHSQAQRPDQPIPANDVGETVRSTRRKIAIPFSSSPCRAALTQMIGPDLVP